MDFAVSCPLVRHWRLVFDSCPSTRTFVPCFLRTSPRGDSPCIFTRPSPPSGRPEDLHLQATEHAQHTTESLTRRTLRVRKGSSARAVAGFLASERRSGVASVRCFARPQIAAITTGQTLGTKVPKTHSKSIRCRIRRRRQRLPSNGSIESDLAIRLSASLEEFCAASLPIEC